MARTNTRPTYPSVKTHEGGKAQRFSALLELRRTLSTCLLFENTFYEGADSLASRLADLATKVNLSDLIAATVWAKVEMRLRHAPLWMAVHLAKNHRGTALIGDCITNVVQRADELAEFLNMYWIVNGKDAPLSKQVKRGLANAFAKFDEYQFSKWDRAGAVKLRDVMFLVHPKPADDGRAALYKAIADDSLPPAETWEVGLSAATSNEERVYVWTHLMMERKLGTLALIRNLRNMEKDSVDRKVVQAALNSANLKGILPYQLYAAWKNSEAYSAAVDKLAQAALKSAKRLDGLTVLIVDVSGSMNDKLSGKSDMDRLAAAGSLAAHLVGVCDDVRVFTFSTDVKEVHPVPGFGMIDRISMSQPHGGTRLALAVDTINSKVKNVDRMIVITDEQAHDGGVVAPNADRGYMVNVAPYQYGVAADRAWVRISGFSPAIVDWIVEEEANPLFSDK